MSTDLDQPQSIKKKTGSASSMVLYAFLLLILYLLSPGPVYWIMAVSSGDHIEWILDMFETIYIPIQLLYDNFEFVENFYDWYGDLLGF